MQQELKISDQVLKQFPMAAILFDLDMCIKGWYGKAEQLFCYTAHQVLGHTLDSIEFDANLKSEVNRILALTKEIGYTTTAIEAVSLKGNEIILELSSSIITDKSGKKNGIIVIFKDITEKMKAEIRVKESEVLLNKIAENFPDSYLFIIEKDYTIGFVSGNELKKNNQTPDDLIGLPVEHIFGEQGNYVREFYEKTFAGKKQSFELLFNKQYQTHNTVPIVSDNGSIEKILSIVKNISVRKNAEIKLEQLLDKSEKQRKATLIILNDLNQTTKKLRAEMAERKKGEKQIEKDLSEKTALLQELYHRTKNNMQTISSLLSLELRRTDNELLKSTFHTIRNRILTMSLVHERLYKSGDLTTIDLSTYIVDLVNLLSMNFNVDQNSVLVEYDMDVIKFNIDYAIPLGLALNEIISNIFKHAFSNGETGLIKIKLKMTDNNKINLSINDNGHGFPADFDPRKTKSLGMYITFLLLEGQLKGNVSCHSENGVMWQITMPMPEGIKRV